MFALKIKFLVNKIGSVTTKHILATYGYVLHFLIQYHILKTTLNDMQWFTLEHSYKEGSIFFKTDNSIEVATCL